MQAIGVELTAGEIRAIHAALHFALDRDHFGRSLEHFAEVALAKLTPVEASVRLVGFDGDRVGVYRFVRND